MELGNKFFRTLRGFDLHTYISRFEKEQDEINGKCNAQEENCQNGQRMELPDSCSLYQNHL